METSGVAYYKLVTRLKDDQVFMRTCFELVIGSPERNEVSHTGFLNYACPFSGCHNSTPKFGLCMEPKSNSPVGFWICFKCGRKGYNFLTFCNAIGMNPFEIAKLASDSAPIPVVYKKTVIEDPVSQEEFSTVWSWIRSKCSLSNEHATQLIERGLDLSRMPPWYSMPSDVILKEAIGLFGESLCRKVSLLIADGNRRDWFAQIGRLAIVYPNRPWQEDGCLEFVSSYQRGGYKKILRPRGTNVRRMIYYRGEPSSTCPVLVVTEGEIKTESSWQAGVPTIGLPGIGIAHEEVPMIINFDMGRTQGDFPKKIVIIGDTDVNDLAIENNDVALSKLIKKIEQGVVSCPPIERRFLPMFKKDEKSDIDSWISYMTRLCSLEEARSIYRRFAITGEL